MTEYQLQAMSRTGETGETHDGQETYTRHDARPPLCDAETLYTAPLAATQPNAAPAAEVVAISDAAGEAFNNMFHKCRAEVSMDWWQRIWSMAARWAWEHPQADTTPTLRSALNAMLTQFGMDEDDWNKPTFDQARRALAATPAPEAVADAAKRLMDGLSKATVSDHGFHDDIHTVIRAALAATTVQQAEPTDLQMEHIADAIWGAQKKRLPMSAAIEFARAVLALKAAQPIEREDGK
jgi:hypothetical protein